MPNWRFVIFGDKMHPGCGIQLAYKMIKDSGILQPQKLEQTKGKPVVKLQPQVFISPAVAAHFIESPNFAQLVDPSSAPRESVVIADDLAAREHESALHQAKDLLYICVNLSGKQQLAKRVGIHAWSATASLAFYDDFIAKLRKAAGLQGLRYIEILTPCPKLWKAEPSNTVEIARQAVEIGLWPIFELDHGRFALSYKPPKLASTDAFASLQKLVTPDRTVLEKSWRSIVLGRPFESEI